MKYIATRPNSERYSPQISGEVSELQSDWIAKELKKSPHLKEECTLEYQAYEEHPNSNTAENLIHKIAEVNIYHGNGIKNYVVYLAKRPCAEFTEQGHAQAYRIAPSMSRCENPYDNSLVEHFFSILKTEWIICHLFLLWYKFVVSLFGMLF